MVFWLTLTIKLTQPQSFEKRASLNAKIKLACVQGTILIVDGYRRTQSTVGSISLSTSGSILHDFCHTY